MLSSYKILWNYNVIKWLPDWYFVSSQNFFVDSRLERKQYIMVCTSQIRQFFCRLTNFMSIKYHLIQKLQRHAVSWSDFWVRHVWKHFLRRKMDFLWFKLAHPCCLWSVIYMVIFGSKHRIEGVKTPQLHI